MDTKELRELLKESTKTKSIVFGNMEYQDALLARDKLRALAPTLAARVIELEEGMQSMRDKVEAYRLDHKDPFCLIEEIDAATKKLLQEG